MILTREINPRQLPFAPINQVSEFMPTFPGIYYCLDNAMRIWYIGQAINLRKRWKVNGKQHEKLPLFLKNGVSKVAAFACNESTDLDAIESSEIAYYKPPLNKQLLDEVEAKPPVVQEGEVVDLVRKWRDLKNLQLQIESEIEGIKPDLISIVEERGKFRIEEDSLKGLVYLVKRNKYSFSPEIAELEARVKEMKSREKEDGTAVVDGFTVYPAFK